MFRVNTEGWRKTYSAGLGNISPAATPTDVAFIQGVAGVVVRITRIYIIVVATINGVYRWNIVKRKGGTQTVADTPFLAGTHSTIYDSKDAASAVITAGHSGVYTTNRTNGTLAGYLFCGTSGEQATIGTEFNIRFGDGRNAKCLILRDATENVCINGDGHTLVTNEVIGVTFEWTEDAA